MALLTSDSPRLRVGRRSLLLCALVFAAVASLGFAVLASLGAAQHTGMREEAERVASEKARDLERTLTRSLAAAEALASMIELEEQETMDRFDALAGELLRVFSTVDALALAPDGIHTHVAPLEGYETVIGFDLFSDPQRRTEAEAAIEARRVQLAGPLPLVGGGTGLFARKPVFVGPERERFWGFVIAALRVETLVEESRLDELTDAGYDHVLARTDPPPGADGVLDRRIDRELVDPVTARLHAPGGDWTLSLAPQRGWRSDVIGPLGILVVLAIAAAVAAALLVLLRRPHTLQSKVDRRTQELQTALLEAWLQKREVQAAEAHLQAILSSTPEAVVAGTGDGIVTEWNTAAERLYGWPREEIVGRPVSLLVPNGRPVVETHADALRPDEPIKVLARRRRRDGSHFQAELTVAGFHDSQGRLRSWVAVVRDVTEEHLIRDGREAMGSSFDAVKAVGAFTNVLAESVPTVRGVALVVLRSHSIRRLAAVDAEGRVIAEDDDLPLGTSGLATDGPIQVPTVLQVDHPEVLVGSDAACLAVLPLVHGNTVIAHLVVGLSEVEDPKARPMTLLSAVAWSVAHEVAKLLLYEREQQAGAKLRELDELQSDFLSTVSHELRTPLTSISGFAATLDDHWPSLDGASRRSFVRRILRQAQRLDELIGGLLDFARLERGGLRVTPRPCGLLTEIHREVAKLNGVLSEHVVEVEGDEHLCVLGDPAALARILSNLLSNAAKFSSPGSTISVSVTRRGPEAVVAVTDRGIGIPASEQDRIFDRFYRIERGDRANSGTGIGLAIAREFVEALGGRIWVESEPGRGTTLLFTLQVVGDGAPFTAETRRDRNSVSGVGRSPESDENGQERPTRAMESRENDG